MRQWRELSLDLTVEREKISAWWRLVHARPQIHTRTYELIYAQTKYPPVSGHHFCGSASVWQPKMIAHRIQFVSQRPWPTKPTNHQPVKRCFRLHRSPIRGESCIGHGMRQRTRDVETRLRFGDRKTSIKNSVATPALILCGVRSNFGFCFPCLGVCELSGCDLCGSVFLWRTLRPTKLARKICDQPHQRRNNWSCLIRSGPPVVWTVCVPYVSCFVPSVLYCTVLCCTVLYCSDVLIADGRSCTSIKVRVGARGRSPPMKLHQHQADATDRRKDAKTSVTKSVVEKHDGFRFFRPFLILSLVCVVCVWKKDNGNPLATTNRSHHSLIWFHLGWVFLTRWHKSVSNETSPTKVAKRPTCAPS